MAISWICEEREKSVDSTAAHVFRGSVYGGGTKWFEGENRKNGFEIEMLSSQLEIQICCLSELRQERFGR